MWQLNPDPDRFHFLIPIDISPQELVELNRRFREAMSIDNWRSPKLRFEYQAESGDFPSFMGGIPTFTERAIHVLEPYLRNCVLLDLNVVGESQQSHSLVIPPIVDCLNKDKSQIQYFSSGRVMKVEAYVFSETPEGIFRIPEEPISRIFVSDNFKLTAERSELKGFVFSSP